MKSFISPYQSGSILKVLILPNSKKNQIVGIYGDPPRLKLKIAAKAIEGKANKELLRFLAKILHISPSKTEILKGQESKLKTIYIELSSAELSHSIEKMISS
jgi:uncharacterized protein (TIGR00251 family)